MTMKRLGRLSAAFLLLAGIVGALWLTVAAQVNLAPFSSPRQQFFGATGGPLSGGKLYSYVAGTSSPLATYLDAGGTTANTNPIVLDSSGSATIFLAKSSCYKFILQDSLGVTQWTVDNVCTGAIELANTGCIYWRNAANSADLGLCVNGADLLGFTNGGNTFNLPNANDTAVGKATTDTLTNKTINNATLNSPTIGGTVISKVPDMVFTCFVPIVTNSGNRNCRWTNDNAITVTRVELATQTQATGCTTSPIFGVSTTSAVVALPNLSATANSGVLSVAIAAGTVMDIGITNADVACGTQPANVMITIQYRMQ